MSTSPGTTHRTRSKRLFLGCNRYSFRPRPPDGSSPATRASRARSRPPDTTTLLRAWAWRTRPGFRTALGKRYSAVPARPAYARHSASTTPRSKTSTCSTKWAMRPTACTGRASCRRCLKNRSAPVPTAVRRASASRLCCPRPATPRTKRSTIRCSCRFKALRATASTTAFPMPNTTTSASSASSVRLWL